MLPSGSCTAKLRPTVHSDQNKAALQRFLLGDLLFLTAMKIQITQTTKDLLDSIGGYITTERGPIAVKVRGLGLILPFSLGRGQNGCDLQGTGTLVTHWLNSVC